MLFLPKTILRAVLNLEMFARVQLLSEPVLLQVKIALAYTIAGR